MGRPGENGGSSPIGIVAGGGVLPVEVAASIVTRGGRVHVLDVNGAADPAIRVYPRTEVLWSKLGKATRALKAAGVREVVMLGTFARPDLLKARPDLDFLKRLPAIVRLLRAGGDDALLRSLIAIFEMQGFSIIGTGDAAPGLLAPVGVLTARKPDDGAEADVVTGFKLIAALGTYDIGQAVVIDGGRVVAVEAAEGTDRMLARIASSSHRGGVLVKTPKPSQDMRVDLPTIGPGTVRNAAAAGLQGIGVTSGKVLIAERQRLVAEGDRAAIFVAGFEARGGEDAPSLTIVAPQTIGQVAQPAASRGDIVNGIRTLRTLASFGAGTAVVIAGGRVLAVGAHEEVSDVLERARSYFRRRSPKAVAVLGSGQILDARVLASASEDRYAGFVLVASRGYDVPIDLGLLYEANRRGQFVATVSLEREE